MPGRATLAKVLEIEAELTEGITREMPLVQPRPAPDLTADGRRIEWIVIHHNGVPGRDIDDIRRSHIARGFRDVGYHRIYLDGARAGEVQYGRSPSRAGAHAKDFNDNSLGYCLIGNGDDDVFDAVQVERLRSDVMQDLHRYGLTPAKVLGHFEVNDFVGPGDHQTLKKCPGRFFDMDSFRASLAA